MNSQANIIAFSAGSIVLGQQCIITPDKNYPELIVQEGLNILPFSIEVHYHPKINHILLKLSNIIKIYAIPDGCAIIYNPDLEFVGTIYCFNNGEIYVYK